MEDRLRESEREQEVLREQLARMRDERDHAHREWEESDDRIDELEEDFAQLNADHQELVDKWCNLDALLTRIGEL